MKKKIDETRNYLLEEIKHNELISKNHKNTWTTLNYMKDMLILFSTIARCVSISLFASVVDIPVGITNSAVELKIRAIISGIKMKRQEIVKDQVNN